MLLIDPKHPCQTPHRSFPRHYFVWMWEAGTMTELCRCTTCGTVEKITRFNGQ